MGLAMRQERPEPEAEDLVCSQEIAFSAFVVGFCLFGAGLMVMLAVILGGIR